MGSIEIPIRVGTVGAPLEGNPMVPIVHRLLNIQNARELSEVLGAVGLAQNMSALRALATEGIQRGHMSLHARSVAVQAGAVDDEIEIVAQTLAQERDTTLERARTVLQALRTRR